MADIGNALLLIGGFVALVLPIRALQPMCERSCRCVRRESVA
jgi:hypothetical protein